MAEITYDAAGVRRAAGKQAQVLNQLVDDLYHQRRGKTQERYIIIYLVPASPATIYYLVE
ncbi:MAG: Divergent family [Eubacteriales bacterium]|nr:Divergent family [Eubacteriales bacterium]